MTDALSLMKVEAELRPLLLERDPQAIASAVMGWVESGLTARAVRGRKIRALGGLLDEIAATMHFPLYVGENEDAFNDCIAELEHLPAGEGYEPPRQVRRLWCVTASGISGAVQRAFLS